MLQSCQLSLTAIQDEARQLVEAGVLSRQQPIHLLCKHFPEREWHWIEQELELHDYLLRDRVGDLVGHEAWASD